jgi:hypothetical protein
VGAGGVEVVDLDVQVNHHLLVAGTCKQQQDNQGVTEIVEMKGRGHALTIDGGWRQVADTALPFVKRFA